MAKGVSFVNRRSLNQTPSMPSKFFVKCNLQNVIIFTLWDGLLFSLVQAWEHSYSNNTVKEDIPNLNKQEKEKLKIFSRLVLVTTEAWWPSGKASVS